MAEKIRERDYNKEMKQSFIDYSMTTITDRALPDVRDGLKPVHRRLLYGMRMLGITHDKPHKKSARIVGDVMGKYHPHGDSSLYEAMVRMAQDFSLKIPLVDGHGNFGSVDGDSAAAMRYTEARLSHAGDVMLNDLDKDVVDFRPNYDDTEREPVVLPARIPNLLINGVEGIATGMATNIPTHNPTEVANALQYYVTTKKPTIDGILSHLSAPDFPMGGVIINEEEVKEFYRTGYGRILMRGKYHIEPGLYGKTKIVFTEIPTKSVGSKTKLVNGIIDAVNDKVLEEVMDVVDESNRDGMRFVIEVRKGTNIDDFMNKLWLKTKLQDTERMQFLVLVDGKPVTLNILQYFEAYTKFQTELLARRNATLLKRINQRMEIVDGLMTAHGMIDAIIAAIRGAKKQADVEKCLMAGTVAPITFPLVKHRKTAERFRFTQAQTDAILNMRLQKLIGLELAKLEKEKKELEKSMKDVLDVLNNPARVKKELLADLEAMKKLYPEERKTTVTTAHTRKIIQQNLVVPVTVTVDRYGYIKAAEETGSETEATSVYAKETTNQQKVVVFTNKGNVHQLKMKDIPKGKKKDRGVPIQVLAKMDQDEVALTYALDSDFEATRFLFVTKEGNGKIVAGKEFETSRKTIVGTKLTGTDEVVGVIPITYEAGIVLLTHKGRGCRIAVDAVVEAKRPAKGNRLAKLPKDDWFTDVYATTVDSVTVNGKDVRTADIPEGSPTLTVKPI